ncbi:hypothetical protein ABDI30_22505 [Paenibacillus cisolokensis]|uniref:hypothetical protein n=1 Tax=Paenibacillus cisolokensis TaxID=1658519 RepID=UPI003D2B0576
MSMINEAHKFFLEIRKDPNYSNYIMICSDLLRKQLYQYTKENMTIDRKQLIYLQWILDASESDFYVVTPSQGVFQLISKEIKSAVSFLYCTTLTQATKRILKTYNELIEIIELHSIEKGHGSRIVNKLINLSKEVQLPLALYAETEELVKYYEQFNFNNHGRLGENKEFLMLRIPEN